MLNAVRRSLPPKSKILLAVSGGKDSMALLDVCLKLQQRLKLQLSVAHIDHNLRKTSARDARFIEQFCKDRDLPFYLKTLDSSAVKSNFEAWGRSARYRFLEELRKKLKYDYILTAHTASDVAETLLMRLVSNKELTSIEQFSAVRNLIRPFLSISSEQILEYAKNEGVEFVEDESNNEEKFLRNKIRLSLLPVLRSKFDRRISETLSTRALGLQEDISGIYGLLARPLKKMAKHRFGSREWLRVVKSEIARLPSFLSWRLAEQLIKPYLGFNLGRAKSKELELVLKGERQAIELPGNCRLRLRGGGIELDKC